MRRTFKTMSPFPGEGGKGDGALPATTNTESLEKTGGNNMKYMTDREIDRLSGAAGQRLEIGRAHV